MRSSGSSGLGEIDKPSFDVGHSALGFNFLLRQISEHRMSVFYGGFSEYGAMMLEHEFR